MSTRRGLLSLSAGLTSLGCGAALVACLGGTGEDKAEKGRAGAVLEFWGGPNEAQRQDQVAAWNKAHPEAQLRFSVTPNVGEGAVALRRLAAAVAGGKGPQLLDFDRFQVATCANWRLFQRLDDRVRRAGLDLGRFHPRALEEATGLDGGLYGLPSSADTRLLLWNKARFEEAGLDPEQPPGTWDELVQMAMKLTPGVGAGGSSGAAGAQERMGFLPEEGQSSLHLFAWQSGGAFQSEDGKKATLALPENGTALEFMKQVVEAQGGWQAARASRARWGTGAAHPFLTGQLALQYQIPDWVGAVVARQKPELRFGAAAPPVPATGQAALSWTGGYAYAIARDAPADRVWPALTWLLSDEAIRVGHDGARARATAAGGVHLPGLSGQPGIDEAMVAAYRTGVAALDVTVDQALRVLGQSRIRERSLAATELWDGVIAAQTRALTGQLPVMAALTEQNAVVQRALDQAWSITGSGTK
jgi:ABC-type glycerol-3-phosphate transport system substrate-binding protein